MRRDLTLAAVLWAVATVASLAIARFVMADLSFPTHGAQEASIVDDAFMTLTYLASPVFGVVIAVLAVVIFRFRARGPEEDGAPLRGRGSIPVVWFGITSALAVVMIIYPGLIGLWALRQHGTPDLQVNVTGQMWQWSVEYPGKNVKVTGAQEFVLPEGKVIEVNVKSVDILHSFWVPAFRQKIDAIPGQVKTIYVTTQGVGEPSDVAYRLQCAELCGVGHSVMAMPVRVVTPAEFDRWLGSQPRVEAK